MNLHTPDHEAKREVIKDEETVPSYTLPELFRMGDGRAVSDVAMWQKERRPELLRLFREAVYGAPPPELGFEVEVRERGSAFGGIGEREQVRLWFDREENAFIDLLIYRPQGYTRPLPVFLGLNFKGNETTTDDPAVLQTSSWTPERHERGEQSSRWPFEMILAEGYAVATFYYGDVAPDNPVHWRGGLSRLAFPERSGLPGKHESGAVAWWAWGLSRALDYLVSREEYDAERVIAIGHSRQGKAALWAAAQDERFAAVISNNSGCTGAALARRCFGETIALVNRNFPHWFCAAYKEYAHREAFLPVDQHQLVALLAPRPVYIASASEDLWADPRGEFLSGVAAVPAYELFGPPAALNDGVPPPVGITVGGRIAYHCREGKHDITEWDWMRYLGFATRLLQTRSLGSAGEGS